MKLSAPFALFAILPFAIQVSAGVFARQDNQRNRGGGNNNNNNDNGSNDGGNTGGGNEDPQTSLSRSFPALSLP